MPGRYYKACDGQEVRVKGQKKTMKAPNMLFERCGGNINFACASEQQIMIAMTLRHETHMRTLEFGDVLFWTPPSCARTTLAGTIVLRSKSHAWGLEAGL